MRSSTRICSWLSALAVAGSLVGCLEQAPEVQDNQADLTWDEFLTMVHREADTGVYIVNGDEPIVGEKKLREFYEGLIGNGELIVHQSGGSDAAWNATQKLNLTYCVSTGFGSNYTNAVTAMAGAAADWEAVANVDFIHVSAQDSNCTNSNNNVLFDVNPVNAGGQYLARAFFPGESRAARNILIDASTWSVTSWTPRGIIRHEIGHTLGFRHEHTRPEAGTCFEDNNWRSLTSYDSSSVMHYPQCNGTQNGDLVITAADAQGAESLYGAPGGGGGGPVCGNNTCESGEDYDSCPADCDAPPPSTGVLSNGVAETGLSGSSGSTAFFTIDIPAGASNLTFNMSGGTGDADLYVRFGSAPTTSSYDCRPYSAGNNENCDFPSPSTGTYHVMIRGYSAYSGVSLVASYDEPGTGGCTPYSDGLSGISGASGSTANYTQDVPACATQVTISISGGTGDADLYVRFGSAPTTSSYDCRPYLNGNNETCSFNAPQAGDYHIMLRGYSAFSGVTLTAAYE